MGTKASQMMQVVYMVKAMYFASLKLAGTLRVFGRELQNSKNSFIMLKLSRDSLNQQHKNSSQSLFLYLDRCIYSSL